MPISTSKDFSDIKNTAANMGREVVDEATDDLRDVANKAGRKVRSLYEAATKELSADADIVATQIRKNPVQSTAIALGAGFLLGALLRRF